MNAPYLVICKDEGVLYLATRRTFPSEEEAETYAKTVDSSREPKVVGTVRPFVIEPMDAVRNHRDHIERHSYCHSVFDELIADYFNVTGNMPSKATVSDLMEWSATQTLNPQLPKGTTYLEDTDE